MEAISIRPGLNDGFKGRRMVAEREEAGASSVHHLDRATIRQIENTLPRIQYRGYISKNMLSRMYFQEYDTKSAPTFVRSQNTLPRMKHTSTMKDVQEYNIKRAPPFLLTIRQILYTSLSTTFKNTSMLSSQNTEPRDHRRNPSITHPMRRYANFFLVLKYSLSGSCTCR